MGVEQQTAFERLKRMITHAETVAYYKVGCRTRIIADASPVGLGAVLAQLQGDLWRVIVYASLCFAPEVKVVYRPGKANIADALSRLNSDTVLPRRLPQGPHNCEDHIYFNVFIRSSI